MGSADSIYRVTREEDSPIVVSAYPAVDDLIAQVAGRHEKVSRQFPLDTQVPGMDLGRRGVVLGHVVIIRRNREPRQSNVREWIPARVISPWMRKIPRARGGVETPWRCARRATVSLCAAEI